MTLETTPAPAAAPAEPAIDADQATFEAEVASIFALPGTSADANEPVGVEGLPAEAPAGEVSPTPASPAVPAAAPTEPAPLPPIGEQPAAAPASPTEPPKAPTPPVAPTAQELELANLKGQLAELTAKLAQPEAAKPAAPTPAPATGSDERQELPAYSLTIPDEVSKVIFGDDPNAAKAGLEHMINSLSTIIHLNVRKEFETKLTDVRTGLDTRDNQTALAEAQAAAKDQYFTAFPDHNSPTVAPILAQEAAKLGTEFPNLPWGPDYINALGARVHAAIAALTPPAGDPAPIVPTNPAPPPAMAPTAPRSGVAPAAQQAEDEITDLWARP